MAQRFTTSNSAVTYDDAPPAPKVLRMTLRSKSMWEKFVERCDGMSPDKLLEFFNDEKARILAEMKQRGKITPDEADFLNRATREKVETILDRFKETVLKQMEITPEDAPKEVEFKIEFSESLVKWLSDLFNWLVDKIKNIFCWIKEKTEWCFEEAKKLFKYLWSLFS